MSNLLVTPINDVDEVNITFRVTENIRLVFVRPHVYLEGELLDGSVVLTIKEGSDILKSATLTNTEVNSIKETAENAHGFLRFDTNVVLNHKKENAYTEYTINIKTTGHTTDTSNYLAICSDFLQTQQLHDNLSKAGYNIELYTI